MRLTEMFAPTFVVEDEASDRASRAVAVKAFDAVGAFLRQDGAVHALMAVEDQEGERGALGIHGRDIPGFPVQTVWIVFERVNDRRTPVIWPLSSGEYAIYLPLMTAEDGSALAMDWQSNADIKDWFVHEFTHYQLFNREKASRDASDAKRAARAGQRGKTFTPKDRGTSSGNDASYFNHPQETNAFYQEATQRMMDMISSLSRENRKKMAGFSTQQLVKLLRTAFPKEMRDNLTAENQRKLDLRLARFAQQTYRPALVTGSLD